ncbi:hypothetical protein [Actinokineospora sp.]|uniref:hypothetical protein n=1 Tax=Actinokineospora sp. TaxID=1872133 RepID=UPI004037F8F9
MSVIVPPGRDDVVDMLSTYGSRQAADVEEHIGSLERAWLIHQVEQRYTVELDFSDEQVDRITTVSAAVSVLAELLAGGDG